ncbi:MAG TPA: prephenate dehydrogenase/arogenate dehydrogenase family protein [Acidimicrobiales bacterium]|nr:prephenate dehydrogenase/arogenate dehydrogenase family protein [Acidimicrobiales bacterium]
MTDTNRKPVGARDRGTTKQVEAGRAQVVGTGLIGASIGLALRSKGWFVTGSDTTPGCDAAALERGALDAIGSDERADVVFVATPLGSVEGVVRSLLDRSPGSSDVVVTDVAGVKTPLTSALEHPRYVGGHPMAGSEQLGVDGADGSLFVGATWVLTPTEHTDPDAFALVRSIVTSLGADVVALSPTQHDSLVAVVSHVPHLTAAALMNLAERTAEEHASLLRLAAGGFRDMTRVAAGHPGIWPDVCIENSGAIVSTLDALLGALESLRDQIDGRDRSGLLETLGAAARARRSLPIRAARPDGLAELRVPVSDRPGVLAEVTTLASDLGINIYDLEIAHSAEGDRGILVLVVDAAEASAMHGALSARGFSSTAGQLE